MAVLAATMAVLGGPARPRRLAARAGADAPSFAFRPRAAGNPRVVLFLGIGLIAVGLVSLVIPGVGWVLGPVLVAAGVVAIVLHFVRVSRATRTG